MPTDSASTRANTEERRIPPGAITVHPIDPAVADVKVMPGVEIDSALFDTHKLIEAGRRMAEVVYRIETEIMPHADHQLRTTLVDIIKFAPGVEVYSASPTLQQLAEVGARMPEVAKRLSEVACALDRTRQIAEAVPSPLTPLGVAQVLSEFEDSIASIIKFAETGE